MSDERALLLSEIRYSERMCQRTARLYRHAQTFGTALAIVGGSGALSALMHAFPSWIAMTGAILLTLGGAILIATRAADKAAMNEMDARRYTALRVHAAKLDDQALRVAIDEARVSDAQEVESLRDVAYNDVAQEVGQPDYAVRLTLPQRMLAAFA